MSEEMSYTDYEGSDMKKRFEMTIPILLLILVFVVVGWQLKWFAGIPLLSQFFHGPNIDIAVIGNDQSLVRALEDIRKDLPINLYVFNKSNLYNIRDPAKFAEYDMIILTEGQDGDTIDLEATTLDYLNSFVASGKPAIVIGLAGSKVTNSTAASGWIKLGFVPVKCKTTSCSSVSVSFNRLTMFVKDINHPILKEFVEPLVFQNGGSVIYAMINPEQGVSILDMEIETGAQTYDNAALVERTGSTGGKVMYFAFHPSLYQPLLYNTIKYLR